MWIKYPSVVLIWSVRLSSLPEMLYEIGGANQHVLLVVPCVVVKVQVPRFPLLESNLLLSQHRSNRVFVSTQLWRRSRFRMLLLASAVERKLTCTAMRLPPKTLFAMPDIPGPMILIHSSLTSRIEGFARGSRSESVLAKYLRKRCWEEMETPREVAPGFMRREVWKSRIFLSYKP